MIIENVFKSMIVLGILISLSSIPVWLITKYPLTSCTLLILGLVFSVGAKLDWIKYNKVKNKM